jgi:hypothetical protein
MPIGIAIRACWLIVAKRSDDAFWDAGRWLPQGSWLGKLRVGTIFEE